MAVNQINQPVRMNMKDLSKAINEAIEEMSNNGTIQEIINKEANDMIRSAVKSAFDYQSPLRKKVKEAVEKSIQVDLNQVDFSKHNTAMISAISKSFKDEMLVGQVAEMKSKIASFFSAPEKTTYTITEFVDALCEQIKNSCVNDYDEDEEVSVTVDMGICGYDFKLSVGDRGRYDDESVRLTIRKGDRNRDDANKIFIVHSPVIELGRGGGVEGWIYGLYSHGVTITDCDSFNIDDCDLTVWDEEQEY